MINTIYIARHGFRLNWITSNWKSVTGTARDPPLAAYGETQAVELAKHLQELPHDVRPTAIFSSPYCEAQSISPFLPDTEPIHADRCLQTATPAAEAFGLPIYVEHGLSEWYSPVEPGTGLHPRPGDAQSLRQYFKHIDPTYRSLWIPSQEGETWEGLQKRTDDFIEAFVTYIQAHPSYKEHSSILLVGHAATCITLVKSLGGMNAPQSPIRIGTCSLSTLCKIDDERLPSGALGAFNVERLADASFLAKGVERDWGAEDIHVDEQGTVVNDAGVPGTEDMKPGPAGLQIQVARM